MPMTRNLGAYIDVHQVLNRIVEGGGGSLEFPTARKAIYFRQRANYYRRLLNGLHPEFDSFQLVLNGAVIIFRQLEVDAIFRNSKGATEALETQRVSPDSLIAEDDPLLTEILALKVRGKKE